MKAIGTNKPCPIPNVSSEDFFSFPPKLRKLALHIIGSDDFETLKAYCEEADIKYDSARSLIAQQRKKGRNFYDLIKNCYSQKLHKHMPQIMKALIREAKKGSIKHIELCLKISNMIKESENGSVTNNLNILMLPALPARPPEERQVIELENEEIKPTMG